MKNIIKYIITFLLMILLFCVTLTLSSILPKKYIEKNVMESAQILNNETNRLMIKIYSKNLYMMFDNFTDSLMINTAYSINTKTPFYSSVVARKNYIEGITKIIYPDTTGELKSSSKYSELDQVGDLNDTVNNETVESFEYARYWHGYLILLRPLLTIMNITQIRILLSVILAILAILLLNMIYKKIGLPTAIIFFMGMIIADYFYMGISLQGAPVFLICMISSIVIMSEKIKDKKMVFLITGGLTSFFDFLTVPIINLGIPLLLCILLKQKEKDISYKKLYLDILILSVFWGVGYFATWFTKWVIADVFYHKEVITSAIQQFQYRSISDGNEKYNIVSVLNKMFGVIHKPLMVSVFITEVMLIYKIIKSKILNLKFCIKKILPYFCVGTIGIMWYIILANHSYLHYIFTYRNFFLISICILLILYNILCEYKEGD